MWKVDLKFCLSTNFWRQERKSRCHFCICGKGGREELPSQIWQTAIQTSSCCAKPGKLMAAWPRKARELRMAGSGLTVVRVPLVTWSQGREMLQKEPKLKAMRRIF